VETANRLVAGGRGLLAMDESNGTCNKRFAEAGIPQTVDMRRAWRDLLITTPGLGACISAPESRIEVRVMPTDEEAVIAHHMQEFLSG